MTKPTATITVTGNGADEPTPNELERMLYATELLAEALEAQLRSFNLPYSVDLSIDR